MKILLIAFTFMTTLAFADHHEENLDKAKAHILGNIDQRIGLLQTLKSCVQSASSKEQMKSCREANRSARKKLHEENKGKREEHKTDMKSKREEKIKSKKNK